MFYGTFYALTTFELFKLYLNDRSLLSDLLVCIAPLIGRISRVNMSLSPLDAEFICTDALGSLCELLMRSPEKFPTHHASDFTKYLTTTIKMFQLQSINATASIKLDPDSGRVPPYGRTRTQQDAEAAIYTRQRVGLLMKLLADEIRFDGDEKNGCLFIAECLLLLRSDKMDDVIVRYNLTARRARYLIDYTRVLVKDLTTYVAQLSC